MRVFPVVIFVAGMALSPMAVIQAQDQLPTAPSTVRQQSRLQQQQPPKQSIPQAQNPPASQPAPAPKNAAPVAALSSDVPEQPEFTYRTRVEEVNVIFTVADKHGKFVKNLSQSDFQVLDNNQPPKQIVSFSRETDLPLRVGLLIDSSNSIRSRFQFEQEAAVEFLTQMVRPKSDKAFVIGFDTTPEVTADFTDDSEKLAQGVHLLRPGGGTALYDAVYYACRDKLMKAVQTGPVRRAIVLLSDGDDNQSRVTREEAIEMAQRAEVIIYTISTNSSSYKERGDKVLERMAEATGGRAFLPLKMEDVANAFSEIQDELRSQYALAYRPAALAADGRYHSIEILAQNHKNLKVRARKGYFAPR